jgi:uncharacterized protein (TIGR03435 family)
MKRLSFHSPRYVLTILATISIPLAFGLTNAAASQASYRSAAPTAISWDYKYDVASFKPSKFGVGGGADSYIDGFALKSYSLKMLIQTAYGISSKQLLGAPDWMSSEMYDIEVKMDPAAVEALQKLNRHDQGLARQQMLQALLADRLKLGVHRETRELAVYTLIIAKKGLKLQEAKPDETPSIDRTPSGETRIFFAKAMPLTILTPMFSSVLRSPIVDQSGLTGLYNFKLQWTPDQGQSQSLPVDATSGQSAASSRDSTVAALISAVEDQLGLKLVPGKGPLEVIVIDHVERPSAN